MNLLITSAVTIVLAWQQGNTHSGIYHFSNAGDITWYEFAEAIQQEAGLSCRVEPIPSSAYPTPARRPGYSVMDTQKITTDFGVQCLPWQKALQDCLQRMAI